MTTTFNHLAPWVHEMVMLPNEERIHQIKHDRWIGYTQAEKALEKLEELITHPTRQRMPNLLIVGHTNNGKSMIVEKFRRGYNERHPEHYILQCDALLVEELPSPFKPPQNFLSGYIICRQEDTLALYFYKKSNAPVAPIPLKSEHTTAFHHFLQESFASYSKTPTIVPLSHRDIEKIYVFTGHRPTKEVPVLVMQMPSDPKISRFYAMLLYSLDINIRSLRPRVADLEIMALQYLKNLKVKILVIDEVHNIFNSRDNVQREFLNLMRFLGNQLKIPIVCAGTKEAAHAIIRDEQLANRFEPFFLPLWTENAELASLLTSILATLPLKKPSNVTTPEFMRLILDQSEGLIGEIVSLLTKAAIMAIQSGEETVNKKTLSQVDYLTPTERQRFSERTLKK